MTASLHALARVLAFLSRFPALPRAYERPASLGSDSGWFPLAGALIALPAGLLLVILHAVGLSPAVAAIAAVGFLVWASAALHEDGLADTADALFGHHSRERALLIMRDSRIGTYGAVVLTLSLGARVALLAELLAVGPGVAVAGLLAAASASRGAMAHLWSSLPPAEPDGLAVRVGQPDPRTGRRSIALGFAAILALGLWTAGLWTLLPLLTGLAAHLLFRARLRRRLGGQTGDTIGCDQQIVEIAVLFGFALAI